MTPPTTPPVPRSQRRPLGFLLVATIISLLGSQITVIALPWFVLSTTGSAAKAGLVGFATLLPGLAVGLFGGVFVDQLGFKRVSVTADVVSGIGIAAIPLCYATIGLAFWQLLVFVFIGSLLAVPALTARRSMVPELAQHAGIPLDRVNALFESCQHLALLLGTPVAGLLVAGLGAQRVLWLDAATFAFSAIAVGIGIPVSLFTRRAFASQGYLQNVLAGLRFIRRDELLWPMVIVLASFNAINASIVGVMLPWYAKQHFGSAASLGVILAGAGGGAFLGATMFGLWSSRLPRRYLWMSSFMLAPFEFWVFTISPSIAVLVAVFFLVGITTGPINPLMVTIRHERSPEALRGRVFSTYSAVSMAAQPLGILLAGSLIDRIGFLPTVIAFAVCSQLIGLMTLIIPAFRQMDALRPAPSVIAEIDPPLPAQV
ncbi:MAG: MFS transporter [Thermomicrobiales bacterium]